MLPAALAALVAILPASAHPARSLASTGPEERANHWRLVPLAEYPPDADFPLASSATLKLFVLRAPAGLRARGYGFALGHELPGLRLDPLNLFDEPLRRMGDGAELVTAAFEPRDGRTFAYGNFVLGRDPFPDGTGEPVRDLDLGRDVVCLSIELDAGKAPEAGQVFPLEGMTASWVDARGRLHKAPVDVGRLVAR
jgi:hypothetical protein